MGGGGGSKEVDAGTWYFVASLEGLSLGPIDAFLEWRASTQVAWKGEVTATGAIAVHKPNLFGGEKDQGGVDGTLRVMFGDASQTPNSYMTGVFGSQVAAWRGFVTVAWEGGKYGANNPYPQKPSYKIRKIKQGWDNDECWYPEKAIVVKAPGVVFTSDLAFAATNATVDGSYAGIVLNSGFTAGDYIIIDKPAGLTYKAWSPWDTDVGHPLPWNNRFQVTDGAGNTTAYWPESYASQAAAETGAAGKYIVLTGSTYYKVWLSDTPVDDNRGGLSLRIYKGGAFAMNPAHILYFLRTSQERGREPTANMADDNLRAAADWFYSQGFGLCGPRKAASVSPAEFEQQICRVAGCSFSRSTLDGKFYIDIANGEYDLESLPVLADDDVLSFKEVPTVLDNAINSVSIQFFDPVEKRKRTSPPVRALALIAAFGENHQTYDFPEIPTMDLANQVALRELLASITPTRRFELDCNRTPEGWRRFQYFRLQLPKRGIADMVCLVGENSDGKLKSGGIKLAAVQDTFSVDSTAYVEAEAGVDTRPSQTPVAITTQRAFEAPYVDVCTRFSSSELVDLSDDAGFLAALALDPAASRDFSLYVAPHSGDYVEYGSEDFCPTATINEAAPLDGTAAAPATSFTFSDGLRLDAVTAGMPAIWGNEWCRVDAIDVSAGTLTLGRGCADTVPQEHDAGDRIFFYADHAASDGKEHVAGETVDIKLLTNTGSERLAEGSATPMSLTFDQRIARPYPPGKVQIGGVYYPAAVADEFTVTWTHRNRQLQANQLVDTTMASVTLANNTRYGLRFLDAADNLLIEQLDIGAATATVALNYTGDVTMELYTIDDTAESMQRHIITFAYTGTGPTAITATAYTPVYDGVIIDGGGA